MRVELKIFVSGFSDYDINIKSHSDDRSILKQLQTEEE